MVPRNDTKLQAYERYAVEMAVLLGAYRQHAEEEMKKMVDFEIEYAKVSIILRTKFNLCTICKISRNE